VHSAPGIFAPVSERASGGGQRPDECSRLTSFSVEVTPGGAELLGETGGVPSAKPASFRLPDTPPLQRHAASAPIATTTSAISEPRERRRAFTPRACRTALRTTQASDGQRAIRE
jgi:hypothetical protein